MVILTATENELELYKIITQFVAHNQNNKKLCLTEISY